MFFSRSAVDRVKAYLTELTSAWGPSLNADGCHRGVCLLTTKYLWGGQIEQDTPGPLTSAATSALTLQQSSLHVDTKDAEFQNK